MCLIVINKRKLKLFRDRSRYNKIQSVTRGKYSCHSRIQNQKGE